MPLCGEKSPARGWKLVAHFGCVLLLLFVFMPPIGRAATQEKKKQLPPPTVLKVGVAVPASRCEANPSVCLCPKNTRPIRYRGKAEKFLFACINNACPGGQQAKIKVMPNGDRQGVCE